MIEISTQRERMDLALIHRFLSEESYWAKGIPQDLVRRSMDASLCFGAFEGEAQVGFARVVTDCATFAWLADVFVVREARGRGISRTLMASVKEDPRLAGIRRWHLVTRDAHRLYAGFGFVPLDAPERHMQRIVENPYGIG